VTCWNNKDNGNEGYGMDKKGRRKSMGTLVAFGILIPFDKMEAVLVLDVQHGLICITAIAVVL